MQFYTFMKNSEKTLIYLNLLIAMYLQLNFLAHFDKATIDKEISIFSNGGILNRGRVAVRHIYKRGPPQPNLV